MAKSTTVALSQDELKKQAAHRAVEYAKSGMVLGLGTGSTTAFAIDRIGELMKNGELKDIIGVPTSIKSYEQASALGIPLATLDEKPEIDLAIDGADEVDPKLNVVKGRGGALLREKLVEQASKKFVCIVDESKLVEGLGGSKDAMPVEIENRLFKRDRHLASKGWFNPEDFTAQKREWAKATGDKDKVIGWPAHLFEQFVIVGLPPTTDVKSVISDAEMLQTAKSSNLDADVKLELSENSRHRGLKGTPLSPQVLYNYPPESPVSVDLPSFCFPHGVQPNLLERTPSMTSLNDLLYSQNYLNSDASSFIFLLKVADNLPLYGVCCYMDEMVHRPPSLLKAKYPDCNMPLTRYLVAAPRCYCFLTHYPFFSLHMKVLHMILGLERLDRITMFIDEGSEEEQQRRRRQATAVEQMRNGPSGPVSVGGHSSMLALHVPPPPVSIRPPGSDSAFPLNPHQSYDEEWGTMAGGRGHDSDSDVFLTPHASAILPDPVFGCRTSPKSSPKQESPGTASQSGFASNQLPIRVALEASEAATIKAGPADPPPRQPGLPPSSGHHRTHSQQVPNSVSRSGGMHRRTSSWQQLQPQQPPQLGAVSISDMAPEHSRGSESTLGGYMTARSDTASGLSEAGHSVATPLSNVQQHLRNFSAQSLSGFSDPGTPLSAAQDRADFLVNATAPHRGPHGFYREGHESPAHQTTGMAGSSDLSWSRLGQSPAGRQGSDPMTPVSPFAAVGQQAAVPAQWHTFDNQPQAMPPGQSQVQQPSQGQVHDQPSSVEPSRHSQGMQEPVGQLHGAPSGVPLEHRSRTMRTMSFRQVVRSASEGDAMAMQAQPATALQVMQAYERSPVPQPGEEFEFCPDPSLQPVHYLRGRSSQGLGAQYVHRAAVAAAEAEAGEGLSSWTIAALCRCLSLDNILLLLTGVLLEKQLVLFCPNIGLLSTCVLSLIPLLRPFTWQSLLLPVLPDNLLSFLEAPVPFVIGVQYKTSEVRSKCSGLMRVNIYKDQIKTSGPMPPLPNDKALYASLRPAYNVLKAAGQERRGGTPMYAISEEQKKAADTMLQALQDYLSSICSELQSYTITDVQTPDRVAVLLKDSYIESFQPRDRAFVRQFTETQMFSVYCDSVIR
ncbi:hypothetical protein WJX79_007211 [Trebouxia sp. C0005]